MKVVLNALTIVLLLFLSYNYVVRPNIEEKRFQDYITYLEQKDSIVSSKVDKMGNLVVTAMSKELSLNNEELLKKTDKKFRELSKRLDRANVQLKRLKSSVSFKAEIKDTVELVRVDTVLVDNNRLWRFSDETISLFSTLDTTNLLTTEYQIKPFTLSVDVYDRKSKWYKPPSTFANITSSNPKLKISNSNVFIKKAKKPSLVVSAGLGGALIYDTKIKIKPAITVTLGKPLIVFYK